ncbi:MAG: hypothetical protein GPOALKHO_000394 [Sodalis sp.]|nr:MAG: hypothetical protein GPOALKHO_000394 [Sodalis sp.]
MRLILYIKFMNKALIVDEHHCRLKLIVFGLKLRNVIYRIDISTFTPVSVKSPSALVRYNCMSQ